jgi:hypothetical protein
VERDKFLIEMMGECCHEWIKVDEYDMGTAHRQCSKCKIEYWPLDGGYTKLSTDFSTWEGFGKLWEWAQKQDWFEWFVYKNSYDALALLIKTWTIHPDRFADAVYDYLRRHRNEYGVRVGA